MKVFRPLLCSPYWLMYLYLCYSACEPDSRPLFAEFDWIDFYSLQRYTCVLKASLFKLRASWENSAYWGWGRACPTVPLSITTSRGSSIIAKWRKVGTNRTRFRVGALTNLSKGTIAPCSSPGPYKTVPTVTSGWGQFLLEGTERLVRN